ncbi:MAG: serine hydrolase domain-containing protein [Actinomycetota bacterium]
MGAHVGDEAAARLPATEQQPTLEDLATHHSGLPNLPLSWVLRSRGDDPYSKLTPEMVFDRLGPRTRRPQRPKFRYSNLGMGLLGHLLEEAGGRPYVDLLRDRLLEPLGLSATCVGQCAGGAEVVQGMRKGKPVGPWRFGALAGCGAVRSTPADLVTLARHLLDPPSGPAGDAIRLATEPRRDGSARDMRIGLGWMLRSAPTGEAIWHNGGTLGGSSFLAVDREHSTAIVALGNSGPGLRPPLDAPSWAALDELATR